MNIDIYQFNLTKPNLGLNAAYNLLDADEQQKADRFVIADVREKFIYAHALLRQVLARNLNKMPELLQYQYNPQGKPELKNHELHFNLSHSKDLALIGICKDAPIGVDIEFARAQNNYLELAQRFFTPIEIAQIKNLNDFYRTWTRKEAYLKMQGLGISFGLNKFSVSTKEAGFDSLISAENELMQNCYLGSINTAENYFAAVCLPKIEELKINYCAT